MSVVEEAFAALGEAEPFGGDRIVFHCTVDAAREVWDTRRPDAPDPELMAMLPNHGKRIIAQLAEAESDWRTGRERIVAGAEGNYLFGYPLVIHEDGSRRVWTEER